LIARDGESAARLALDLAHDVPRLRAVSAAAARLVDGHGARRLGDALRELCGGFDGAGISLRPARLDDARLLFEWRNDAETRRQSRDSAELSWADHLRWLETKLADPRCRLLIAEAGRQVGTVRIDRVDEGDTSIFVLSWTVAPEARGKGYGKLIVRAARPEGRVRAYVKRDNPASQAIAAAAGLRLVEDSALQVWEGDATD
jgi:RimJ/RimL family protein N-acetyltransferase